jgi:hypothetical protein
LFFPLLFALLLAARLCHVQILWAEETLPLAAARQMLAGKALYRDIWFDKPPAAPLLCLAVGAEAGWPLRVAGALYALLCCWVAFGFARDLWGQREGFWAAGLLGFFLIFDFPSAVIPLASDLLMLAPHLAAVWMAHRRRPFWSGALVGVAFLISPKAVFVLLVCALWVPGALPAGALLVMAGFASVSAAAARSLWSAGALAPYWDQVWKWGRVYAGTSFVEDPVGNGLIRTLNWAGFHAAIVVASGVGLLACPARRSRWLLWLAIGFAAVAAGLRFFPRYYFQLLPVVVLLAARGFTQLTGQRRRLAVLLAVLLLMIPAVRFGPQYVTALRGSPWRDTSMDRDSRVAASLIRGLAKPGDTLFVWGYRPEIYVYSGLPAATRYLDSQPLTGVPADRHLTQSAPVETRESSARRVELALSRPDFVLDGLGTYNPRLAITNYPDLGAWLANYREVAHSGQTIIYRRVSGSLN